MVLKLKIKTWWNGEFTPHENAPNSNILFVGGKTKYHWTAKVARALFSFTKNSNTKNWKNFSWKSVFAWVGFIASVIAIISFLFPRFEGVFAEKLPIPYHSDQVALTWPNEPDGPFLDFLYDNVGRTVYLDLNVDMSLSIGFNTEVDDACTLFSKNDKMGEIFNEYLSVPFYVRTEEERNGNYKDEFHCDRFGLKFVSDRKKANVTHGGIGVIQTTISGFFDVEPMNSGAFQAYILTEKEATVDLHAKYQQAIKYK